MRERGTRRGSGRRGLRLHRGGSISFKRNSKPAVAFRLATRSRRVFRINKSKDDAGMLVCLVGISGRQSIRVLVSSFGKSAVRGSACWEIGLVA